MSEIIKQSVGIDIAKDNFVVCIATINSAQQIRLKRIKTFKNELSDFIPFLTWVRESTDTTIKTCFVMEATGVYHENLAHWLNAMKQEVCIPLGNKVKNYAKSLNIRSKTDNIDAKVIAMLGAERVLEPWKLAFPNIITLRQLTREHESLQDERSVIGAKLHNLKHSHNPHKKIIKRLEQRMKLIDSQLNNIIEDIKRLLKKDNRLSRKIDCLLSIKGIGLLTAVTIAAETQGFSLFKNKKQLVSYAGYDVVERQSGTSINGKRRISKKGNRRIRRILHFPAIVAATHSNKFKSFYQRVNEGKPSKMVGCVAVQKKLLILMFSIWKHETSFDENYNLIG